MRGRARRTIVYATKTYNVACAPVNYTWTSPAPALSMGSVLWHSGAFRTGSFHAHASTFDIMRSDPKLGRAEALRRAMLALMKDASDPFNAYPAMWGPFMVVEKEPRGDRSKAQMSSWPSDRWVTVGRASRDP